MALERPATGFYFLYLDRESLQNERQRSGTRNVARRRQQRRYHPISQSTGIRRLVLMNIGLSVLSILPFATGMASPSLAVDLLPALRRGFPTAVDYTVDAEIIQANANGYKLTVELPNNECTKVFLKQVAAAEYRDQKKDWPDLRRTLLYARTEARFYSQFLPKLQAKGAFIGATPGVYCAEYELEGWIDEDEVATVPADPSIDKNLLPNAESKGGLLILECISEATHFQDSPLEIAQCYACLEAVAELHAAAWQDVDLLREAEQRLSRASFHLSMRNPKELAGSVDAWNGFMSAFESDMKEHGVWTDSVRALGTRMERLAVYVSEQVSPSPTDPYATIIHGDYKSMNVFLPKAVGEKAKLVDFASTGLGLGMSDLAMHIRHALVPERLENGGEEAIVLHYWQHLVDGLDGDYPWPVAWRHYKLAVVDYFRFFLARMWKSASPATMQRKAENKNVSLINRSVPAAMAFLKVVDEYLREIELECPANSSNS